MFENQRPSPIALGGDQDALGVHAVEDVAEAHALLADQVLGRDLEIVDEHLGGVVVDHRLERADLDRPCRRLAQIDEEDRQAVRSCFCTSSSGVVRASSSIRSECSAREVQTFWPLTT